MGLRADVLMLYVNIRVAGEAHIYIYMSIHAFWIQNVFYICFSLMFMMISILYAVTGCMICLCVCSLM
jgi:hypothetical protein